MRSRLASILVAVLVTGASVSIVYAEGVHFSYLWHLEQPVYWPARQTTGSDRYERAWESIQRTDGGAPHPADALRTIFSVPDRVAAYQHRPRDTINLIRGRPEAGAQVSYSGGLAENIFSLGNANQLGYGPNWFNPFREARQWTTVGGKPRCDLVLFSFHHALLPLCDDSTVRKEIQLYKRIYAEAWGGAPGLSRGFFPSEMAFSERLIPILADEGIAWVIVSNEHLSRACVNFPLVLGGGGVNCEPPNAADARNPSATNWVRTTISRGCSPVNSSPFSYTPHRARYVNPATGVESRIIVVPADQALSWRDGYAPLGVGELTPIAENNPPSRPQLVLLAHDGDNAWGGGFSYYMEAVPNFVNNAAGSGYVATTIEQYLADHPVPEQDLVHVEDGAWVNADGDFGSPTFLNWNWPLLNASGQVDIANGWHVDERNWAIITAAQNRLDTAEQIAGAANIERILHPDGSTTPVERAWHYFLAGLNSGFMYYGTPLDHEVKPTLACNRANELVDPVIGNASQDATPPTVWLPQRFPYNPGSINFGPQHSYQQVLGNGDFQVWTFAYDVSGIASVLLRYRLDDDAIVTDANMSYVGGSGVGAWQDVPMTRRVFPAGNVHNDPNIDFFLMPTHIADQYHTTLAGIRSQLVDYYVEAVDARGYVRRSAIQHVFVGSGGGAPGEPRVTWSPDPALAGMPVGVSYDAAGGPIANAATVRAHVGFNQWTTVLPSDIPLTFNAPMQRWQASVDVPLSAWQIDVAFNDGAGQWDNNNGQDWHVSVVGTQTEWLPDGQLDADATLVAERGALRLMAGVKGTRLYVAAADAGEGNDHFIFVAVPPGNMRGAPWAKSGQAAEWSCFVADENNNNFSGWFDVRNGAFAQSAAPGNGGWLEGVIDIAAQTGAMPDTVWLSFAPYATADGGALAAGAQVPAGNGNGNIEAAEYVAFDTVRRGDMNGDWRVNAADVPGFIAVLLENDSAVRRVRAADMNADGTADAGDLGAFVLILSGP